MAKYIIDIPDEKTYLYVNNEYAFLSMPISVGENENKSISAPTFLRIKPYTEPDEDEVWEFAKELISMSENEVSDMIGYTTNFGEVMYNMTYQEAKARYEEWKQKEEIEVGDELKDDENIRAVVLDILDADYESYEVITENGIVDEWQKGIVVKTGRHFSDIEELLKKMREE